MKVSIIKELIFLVEESLEGGYEARGLDTSIFTEGETLQELKANIKDAVKCHFDEPQPRISDLFFPVKEI